MLDSLRHFPYDSAKLVEVSAQQARRARAFAFLMPTAAPRPCRHPGCATLVAWPAAWCEKHQRPADGSFADKRRGSRHARGYGNKWDASRERILSRDAGLCQQCLREGRLNHCAGKKFGAYVDHVRPKAQGGTDDDSNLETLCRTCHTAKTQREAQAGRGG